MMFGFDIPPGLLASPSAGEEPEGIWLTMTSGFAEDWTTFYGYDWYFGSFSPNTMTEVGYPITTLQVEGGAGLYLALGGSNIPSGTLRLHIDTNSILLSTMDRFTGGDQTAWYLEPLPGWATSTLFQPAGSTYQIRISED